MRSNDRPLVRGVVGLHASFTVSDDTIHEAGDLCRELDMVVHVHVAEDGADVDDAIRRGYRGPVERLQALGGLPAGSILAHGVHLDAAQVRKADALGCWIVQNPRSNHHNKVGYPRALAESARVALGTDGFVSDMGEVMSVLFADALLHGEDAGVVARRAAGGQALVAEICDFSGDRPAAPEISNELMDEIRAEAREAAAILWTRMAVL